MNKESKISKEKNLKLDKSKLEDLYLYAISKTSSRTIELTVLQGKGPTLRLKNEFALMLARDLIDHVLR